MPYGYSVNNGYFGLVDGSYILFPTEEEYYDFWKERETDDKS